MLDVHFDAGKDKCLLIFRQGKKLMWEDVELDEGEIGHVRKEIAFLPVSSLD